MQKLRKQAHEAKDRTDSMEGIGATPASAELDRIGGKTHLISASPVTPGTCPVSSPSSSNSASSPSQTMSTPSSVSTPPYEMISTPISTPIPHEQIHPTIVSDMRTFEGFTSLGLGTTPAVQLGAFTFDINQAFPLPLEAQPPPDSATFQDVSTFLGEDFFVPGATATSVSAATTALPHFMAQPMQPDMSTAVPGTVSQIPVLDATWQSFVEQLGF